MPENRTTHTSLATATLQHTPVAVTKATHVTELHPTAPPSVSSIAPTTAIPGVSMTVTGSGFGASQGSNYLTLSDGATSWGAPGDQAAFEVISWSDTEITFVLPEPSGPNNEWALLPETTATLTVSIASELVGIFLHSNPEPILITAVPVISGLNVTEAGPGDTVVVNGRYFGAQRGSGYLQFSDNGVNWGAPGNVAPFTIAKWSDTQIVFTVPTASDGWKITPGTQASIAVTNSAAATSNQLTLTMHSGVRWPVTVNSGPTTIGSSGNGHMQTAVTITSTGALTAMTQTWDSSGWGPLTGFHGACALVLWDDAGNQLETWQGGPWGVDGGQTRNDRWTEQLTNGDRLTVVAVSVVNFYDPQYQVPGAILNWIVAHLDQIKEAAQIIQSVA